MEFSALLIIFRTIIYIFYKIYIHSHISHAATDHRVPGAAKRLMTLNRGERLSSQHRGYLYLAALSPAVVYIFIRILRTSSCPDFYPPRRPWVHCTGRILFPGFIQFPLTLTVGDVVHSLPQGDKIDLYKFN